MQLGVTPSLCRDQSERNSRLVETLRTKFQFDAFQTLQESAIESILDGKDTCVFFATGMGKTLCYQVPAVAMNKIVVVVSPLLSLIQDQVDKINSKLGYRVAMSLDAAAKVVMQGDEADYAWAVEQNSEDCDAAGDTDGVSAPLKDLCLVYITPERMNNMHIHTTLKRLDIIKGLLFFAVDEAHMVSSQGYDFRPSYKNMRIREIFPHVPIMALTATAPSFVRGDIIRSLGMHDHLEFKTSVDKKNLSMSIIHGKIGDSAADIARQCIERNWEGVILCFTYSRKNAEMLCNQIKLHNTRMNSDKRIELYHGQMDMQMRLYT